MAWFGFGKKEEEVEEEDFGPVRMCQGCGTKEDEENKLRTLKQQTTDGKYEFLFCRKCYRMMKKGKMPPLIAQMQGQKSGR